MNEENVNLTKLISIKENKDFKRVYNSGSSFVGKNCVLYFNKNIDNRNRFGFTTSKKIGNAVERNRARRKIKEICRLNQYKLKNGFNIVIVVRARAIKTDSTILEKEIINHFKKAGLLIDS